MNKNKILSGGGKNLTGGGKWGCIGREVMGEGEERWGKGGEVGNGYPPCPPPHMWIYRMFCQGPFPKAGWTDSSCKFRRNYLSPLPSSNYSGSSVRV